MPRDRPVLLKSKTTARMVRHIFVISLLGAGAIAASLLAICPAHAEEWKQLNSFISFYLPRAFSGLTESAGFSLGWICDSTFVSN